MHTRIRSVARSGLVVLTILGPCQMPAEDFDIPQLMLQHGLAPFTLSDLPMQQFFENHYYVSTGPGGLMISKENRSTNVSAVTRGEIRYIGTNKGEWGGRLEAVKGGVHQKLMDGNIVHLLEMDTKLFVFEGLAHLSISTGSVSVIPDIDNPTIPELITRLPDAPQLVYLDDTRVDFPLFIIAGHQSLMSLNPFNHLSVLYWDAFWTFGLTLTSIVRYEDSYFVGLPHGIAVIPAPSGPSSAYCRNDSETLPENSCEYVQFYADRAFRDKVATDSK